MSTSSCRPGRPPKNTSTISSKLNIQNGSLRLRGLSTWARSPKQWPYSLCASSMKMRRSGRARSSSWIISAMALDLPTPVAEHREMFVEHVVGADERAGGAVLMELADGDHVGIGQTEHQPEFARAHWRRRIGNRRIGGDAAAEPRGRRVVVEDFADDIEMGDRREAAAFLHDLGGQGHVRDHAEQQRTAGADADEFAHRDPCLFQVERGDRRELDLRLRATHREDAADWPLALRALVRPDAVGMVGVLHVRSPRLLTIVVVPTRVLPDRALYSVKAAPVTRRHARCCSRRTERG